MARAAARQAPPDITDATCPCGSAVSSVLLAGMPTTVDRDPDPDGDIGGMKIGGRLVFTTANIDEFTGPAMRFRRHRCPHTMQGDLRRKIDADDTAGPCAGHCGPRCPCGCGGRVPRRYGSGCDTMCRGCRARRTAPRPPLDAPPLGVPPAGRPRFFPRRRGDRPGDPGALRAGAPAGGPGSEGSRAWRGPSGLS